MTIEDFLEPHGLTLEGFATEMNTGWLFGYVRALQRAGIGSIVVCVSRGVDVVTELTHQATGVPILAVPASPLYRALAGAIRNPHGRTAEAMFGPSAAGPSAWLRRLGVPLIPYLATPLLPLARVLRARRVTALFCQEYEFPRFDACALVCAGLGLPLFGIYQGGSYRRWSSERLVRRPAIRSARALVVSSRAERERVGERYGLASARLAAIPNPIDTDVWQPPDDRAATRRELGIPNETRLVAWHGRVEVAKKGLDVLLGAWAHLAREDRRLLLIGDGADASELRSRIAGSGLHGVHFHDHYLSDGRELARLLGAADVYVLPSRHEGMAVAPLEAMACGLPLVATRVSGVAETLPDGEASGGLTVPAEDPASLAGALAGLLDDPAHARELGARARQTALERFSLDAVGRQLAAVLETGR
jgi:starch synthase